MSFDIKKFTIAAEGEWETARAELLRDVLYKACGASLEIEPHDPAKKQISVALGDFALSLAPAEYGWRTEGSTLFISCGAFVDFCVVAEKFADVSDTSDKLFIAEGRHFEPRSHTVAMLNAQSDARIEKILNTENTDIGAIEGVIYYISEKSGNDANDGTSPATPWKTSDALKSASLNAGDAVLFERGGFYRSQIVTVSGVTYGSYGEGEKPIICGSKRNYAKGNLWTLHDAKNKIWCLDMPIVDPGIIVFNAHLRDVYCYGEVTGERVLDTPDMPGYQALLGAPDLSFYWGTPETVHETFNHRSQDYPIYLKSVRDPNTDFSDIEIGEDIPLFYVGQNTGVTADNLCMKYCGGHAVRASKIVKDLNVTNCVFAWIGGSLLWKDTRYGNAIEIFGGCDGFNIRSNWIYEIYDTGITFQYHFADGDPHMDNIVISDNVVERSYWLLEWWLSPDVKGATCSSKNILIENNFLKFGFKSWGTVQHGLHVDDDGRTCSWGAGIASGNLGDHAENVVIRGNILDRSYIDGYDHVMTRLMNYFSGGSAAVTEWYDNSFIQLSNQFFARVSNSDGAVFYNADKESVDIALSRIPFMNGEKICLIKND